MAELAQLAGITSRKEMIGFLMDYTCLLLDNRLLNLESASEKNNGMLKDLIRLTNTVETEFENCGILVRPKELISSIKGFLQVYRPVKARNDPTISTEGLVLQDKIPKKQSEQKTFTKPFAGPLAQENKMGVVPPMEVFSTPKAKDLMKEHRLLFDLVNHENRSSINSSFTEAQSRSLHPALAVGGCEDKPPSLIRIDPPAPEVAKPFSSTGVPRKVHFSQEVHKVEDKENSFLINSIGAHPNEYTFKKLEPCILSPKGKAKNSGPPVLRRVALEDEEPSNFDDMYKNFMRTEGVQRKDLKKYDDDIEKLLSGLMGQDMTSPHSPQINVKAYFESPSSCNNLSNPPLRQLDRSELFSQNSKFK